MRVAPERDHANLEFDSSREMLFSAAAAAHAPLFTCVGAISLATLRPPHRNHPPRNHHHFLLDPKPFSPPTPPRSWNPNSPLHHVSLQDPELKGLIPSSAAAVAAVIRRASPSSPVEFTQRVDKCGPGKAVLPSTDFQRLCVEQLDLFRMVIDQDAVLSVYVRPAGSYVMDELELRRVTFYPRIDISKSTDCLVLVGNFAIPAGLRTAEAALSNEQVSLLPEIGTVVLPMVKHPFIIGFLVAEFPHMKTGTCFNMQSEEQLQPFDSPKERSSEPPGSEKLQTLEIQALDDDIMENFGLLTNEQRSAGIRVARSLAMAYVMDQRAMLLQQSSWQNNVRMSHLVKQIHDSLSSIRALSKMLLFHVKRSEISSDIIEDILVQGDHIKDALQQLQDAVYLTKANIVRYNEETLKKMYDPLQSNPESIRSVPSGANSRDQQNYRSQNMSSFRPLDSGEKDIEMPMPPLLLVPVHPKNTRPCTVSDVLTELVSAAVPLANKQQRFLELRELSYPLQVVVEESALRQALSNLIEGALLRTKIGGRVEIYATGAPAVGAVVIINDDGPDMHYMTQMHSLKPFGADLFSDGMVEDNMTWNFVAGLTVAREILENYGCVICVTSPREPDAAPGAGGTCIELWLPTSTT